MPRPIANPPNPWQSHHVEWLGEPPDTQIEVYEEEARSILSENKSPDVPFRWGVNPYRGCFHGCTYCYARTSHEYLGYGAGTDFERKLVVKSNAPDLLRQAFARRSWKRELVSLSGITDCYQPLEANYELTKGCLEACLDFSNPVSILTKAALVQRDAALLSKVAERSSARVHLSIPFATSEGARAIEPYVPTPAKRFETLRVLSEAGVHVGIAIAPVIPGLNDQDVPELLERAKEAGAKSAFMILLRLPGAVRSVFFERLKEAYPDRWKKVENGLRDARGGRDSDARFGSRMSGSSARWKIVEQMFETTCRRLGIEHGERIATIGEERKAAPAQQTLFDL
ncbi:MAG: PA0069 family radical SAM protein [Planctomycetota bacterium]